MRTGLILVAALAGCSSQIMQGFVGHPVQDVMVSRGPPANAFDMPDGRRAFQWVRTGTYVTPTYVDNSGSAYPVGNTVWWSQNTQIYGGQPVTSECVYTLYGRWNGNAWIIEGIERPSLLCE